MKIDKCPSCGSQTRKEWVKCQRCGKDFAELENVVEDVVDGKQGKVSRKS